MWSVVPTAGVVDGLLQPAWGSLGGLDSGRIKRDETYGPEVILNNSEKKRGVFTQAESSKSKVGQ